MSSWRNGPAAKSPFIELKDRRSHRSIYVNAMEPQTLKKYNLRIFSIDVDGLDGKVNVYCFLLAQFGCQAKSFGLIGALGASKRGLTCAGTRASGAACGSHHHFW